MSPEKQETRSTLSIQTLVISSLAAVAAAIVVPMFWERGSLLATAITPIIVAIVSETLNRPAKVITAATPKVTRRTATGAALRSEQPTGVGARGGGPEQLPPRREDPFGLYEPRSARAAASRWRLAVITGLLAAVIGATVVTASELAVFGHQIGNTHRSTGLLGGKSRKATATPRRRPTATETRPRRRPQASPTPTATETADADARRTATPERPATATATPTATPPTEATPVPTATP